MDLREVAALCFINDHLKANRLWPVVIFNAVSNVYIQKIMPPLTGKIEGTAHWLGEYGIMFAIVTVVFGINYWQKGIKQKL